MIKNCLFCKIELNSSHKRKKCCSYICRGKLQSSKNGIYVNCKICNKRLFVKKSRAVYFLTCSKKCKHINQTGSRYNTIGRFKHKGYIYILIKNHPNADKDGYILEHRYVMEQHIGRYLLSKEIIHHKNRIRNDNRIENLELISSQSKHMKEHHPKGTHIYERTHPWIGKKHSQKSKNQMKDTWAKRKSNTIPHG